MKQFIDSGAIMGRVAVLPCLLSACGAGMAVVAGGSILIISISSD
jgi:hypothetical protein